MPSASVGVMKVRSAPVLKYVTSPWLSATTMASLAVSATARNFSSLARRASSVRLRWMTEPSCAATTDTSASSPASSSRHSRM